MTSREYVDRYQREIVSKTCIECGVKFEARRSLKAICSNACKKKRREKFRPKTFRPCLHCGIVFGPLHHLSSKFCSQRCHYANRKTKPRAIRKTITKARSAQSLLRYHVQAGNIVRPSVCEECGSTDRKIEGAHRNYDEPLNVRWLCRPCHVRWDKKEPKGATYRADHL